MRNVALKITQVNTLKNHILAATLAVTCAFAATQANAAFTVDAAVGGAPTGVTYSNFNNIGLGNAGGTSGGIAVSFSGDAAAVQGASSGIYAAPFLSNNNGALFGDATNGANATTYMSTGIGSVTMQLGGEMKYFGLLWGSVDNYNSLQFYAGDTLVGTLTGTDIWAGANGDQGENGTFYVNVNSDVAFDRVVASSTGYAFEFDNVAYNTTPASVPEPATLAMFGLCAGLGLLRRRKAA